jgi:hypothetical protein
MQRSPASNNPLWRGLIGCVVAYALIINAVLSGVLRAEWVAQAAAGLVGEHCLTYSGGRARRAVRGAIPGKHRSASRKCAHGCERL